MANPLSTSWDQFLSKKLGHDLPLCLLLVVITLLVYGQVRQYDFIIWDDPLYVTRNLNIQTGISLGQHPLGLYDPPQRPLASLSPGCRICWITSCMGSLRPAIISPTCSGTC